MGAALPTLEMYKTNLFQIAQAVELLALREKYIQIAQEERNEGGYRAAVESVNKKISEILKLDYAS